MSPKLRRMWTVLATTAATIGLMASLTSTAQAAVEYYDVLNYKANRCMSLDNGGSTANGTNIVIYNCNDSQEQTWYLTPSSASPGYGYIKNYKAGADKCMSVADGGSTAKGAEIILWTCNGGPEQRWQPYQAGNGWVWLLNYNSGLVVSLDDNGSTANNTHLIQWNVVSTGYEQLWGFFPDAA